MSRTAVKDALRKWGLYDMALSAVRHQTRVKARLNALRDRKKIRAHLGAETRKLHLAAGSNVLPGWLNSDIYSSPGVVYVDATKRLPFGENVFDYVFNEHMIEHISYSKALDFLAEVYRVLKPGGKLRVATPDLLFLIELYRQDKSPLQAAYIEWATDRFAESVGAYADTFVINNFVRDWGHTFIYDEKVLQSAMEKVGFADVVRRRVNQSDDEALRGLENDNRMPEGFLELESLILEGTKPNR